MSINLQRGTNFNMVSPIQKLTGHGSRLQDTSGLPKGGQKGTLLSPTTDYTTPFIFADIEVNKKNTKLKTCYKQHSTTCDYLHGWRPESSPGAWTLVILIVILSLSPIIIRDLKKIPAEPRKFKVNLKCAERYVVLTCLNFGPNKLPVFTGYDMFLARPPKMATWPVHHSNPDTLALSQIISNKHSRGVSPKSLMWVSLKIG